MITTEALKKYFLDVGWAVEDDAILKKCRDLCNRYKMDEESFVELWVAFISRYPENTNLTLDNLVRMEQEESKKRNTLPDSIVEEVSSLGEFTAQTDNRLVIYDDSENDSILEIYGCKQAVTAKSKRPRSPEAIEGDEGKMRAVAPAFLPDSYLVRPNTPSRYPSAVTRGKLLLQFGPDVASWTRDNDCDVRVAQSRDPHVPDDALYMFEILSKQASILTFVCEKLGERLRDIWSEGENSDIHYTADVRTQSQSRFRTWGRICSSIDKKMDVKSVMLEGCKRPKLAKSSLISLNLAGVKQYSVFPGQIVAVECTNTTGNALNVNELFARNYVPAADAPRLTDKLNVAIAAGPFTPSDNLSYQPLWDLMERVAIDQPHLLVLIGPFVDCSHPEIASASVKDTFQRLFEKIVARIMNYLKGMPTRVVLVASNRDAHHDPIFPTPAYAVFNGKTIPDSWKLHLMPDPCILDANGLTLGITSVDSIKHLGSEEISNTSGMDRISRLVDHLLSQSCFYPLYPPAISVNVDVALWEKYAFFNRQPHLLILPSDMRYYCKAVNDCIVVNPERLHKYTYAKLCIRPTIDGKWTTDKVSCEIAKV